MSVILLPNQRHQQLSDNPEGKRVVFIVFVTVALVWLTSMMYSSDLRKNADRKAVAMLVESGYDRAGADVVALAKKDPGSSATLDKDGMLTIRVDSTVANKQAIAVMYKRLARVKHATTIKAVMVESSDGDRSSPEYP